VGGAASVASGPASPLDEVDATTSGIGAAMTALAGASGSISFPAAASGGAMIDFDAISGVAGVAACVGAGVVEAPCPTGETVAGPCPWTLASIGGFSAVFACLLATGATAGAGAGSCEAGCGSAVAEEAGTACAEAAGEFCRAIAPVTESRPCSRTVTREYNRSRSPLSVSMADASSRVWFWLSLATD